LCTFLPLFCIATNVSLFLVGQTLLELIEVFAVGYFPKE
jgi:hypothetical protein